MNIRQSPLSVSDIRPIHQVIQFNQDAEQVAAEWIGRKSPVKESTIKNVPTFAPVQATFGKRS